MRGDVFGLELDQLQAAPLEPGQEEAHVAQVALGRALGEALVEVVLVESEEASGLGRDAR